MSPPLPLVLSGTVLAFAACSGDAPSPGAGAEASSLDTAAYRRARTRLVEELRGDGIEDERVLRAIGSVLRHELVPENDRARAYRNHPLPIGHQQTISQPYIVALMTELAELSEGDKVLEVGTGSGYQSAVLAEVGAEVYSIEVVEPLGQRAARDLARLGYADRVTTRIGDGYRGWPEQAPFDAIVITAAPPRVPEPLLEQLAVGGHLVVPVGDQHQQLIVVTRTETGYDRRRIIDVRFVPMTGEVRQR